jgi:hypothetical protein
VKLLVQYCTERISYFNPLLRHRDTTPPLVFRTHSCPYLHVLEVSSILWPNEIKVNHSLCSTYMIIMQSAASLLFPFPGCISNVQPEGRMWIVCCWSTLGTNIVAASVHFHMDGLLGFNATKRIGWWGYRVKLGLHSPQLAFLLGRAVHGPLYVAFGFRKAERISAVSRLLEQEIGVSQFETTSPCTICLPRLPHSPRASFW